MNVQVKGLHCRRIHHSDKSQVIRLPRPSFQRDDVTPEELAGRLTEMFRGQAEVANDEQRASVRRWQGRDRFYRQVQRAAAQVVARPKKPKTLWKT